MSIPTITFEELKDIVSKQKYDIDNNYDNDNNLFSKEFINIYSKISDDIYNGKIPYLEDYFDDEDERQKLNDEEAEKMKNITPSFISDEKRQIWQMKQII